MHDSTKNKRRMRDDDPGGFCPLSFLLSTGAASLPSSSSSCDCEPTRHCVRTTTTTSRKKNSTNRRMMVGIHEMVLLLLCWRTVDAAAAAAAASFPGRLPTTTTRATANPPPRRGEAWTRTDQDRTAPTNANMNNHNGGGGGGASSDDEADEQESSDDEEWNRLSAELAQSHAATTATTTMTSPFQGGPSTTTNETKIMNESTCHLLGQPRNHCPSPGSSSRSNDPTQGSLLLDEPLHPPRRPPKPLPIHNPCKPSTNCNKCWMIPIT